MALQPNSKAYALYDLPEYVKTSQLCQLLGISRGALFNSFRQGLFPAPVKIGSRVYRWAKRDLLAYFGEFNEESANG